MDIFCLYFRFITILSCSGLDKVGNWLDDFNIDETVLKSINVPSIAKENSQTNHFPKATLSQSSQGNCDILSEDSGILQDMAYSKQDFNKDIGYSSTDAMANTGFISTDLDFLTDSYNDSAMPDVLNTQNSIQSDERCSSQESSQNLSQNSSQSIVKNPSENNEPFCNVVDAVQCNNPSVLPPEVSSSQHYTFGSCLCGQYDLSTSSATQQQATTSSNVSHKHGKSECQLYLKILLLSNF